MNIKLTRMHIACLEATLDDTHLPALLRLAHTHDPGKLLGGAVVLPPRVELALPDVRLAARAVHLVQVHHPALGRSEPGTRVIMSLPQCRTNVNGTGD